MYRLRKRFTFEAAHVLNESYSKECQNIHGHSYVLEIFLTSENLIRDGMICDFKALKKIVQKEIIEVYDHALIVWSEYYQEIDFPNTKILEMSSNPTAENMARDIYERLSGELEWCLEKVRLHETETGWVEYYYDGEKGNANR